MEKLKTPVEKKQKQSKINTVKELSATSVVVGFLFTALLSGLVQLGAIQLSTGITRQLGGILIAYMVVGTVAVAHLAVKNLAKKG